MPPSNEATLTEASARLDACIAANDSLCANLERMGQLPVPAAEAALDDLYDLAKIVGSKLLRAWTAIDAVLEPIRVANDNAEHEAWIVSLETEAANDDRASLDIA